MSADVHRLVLWDIDLTLIELRGVGRDWYAAALSTVTGLRLREMPTFAGRTERAITAEVLTAHGVDADQGTIDRMWAELVRQAAADEPRLAERGRALSGAAAALSAVAARESAVQTLVTGNLAEVARHKLTAFGLDPHIDFESGGYGSQSAHRPDLVEHAIRRASTRHGTRFASESVAVVGDTPHDVESALVHGATAVGVATGRHSAADLHAAGAHVVLDDLADTERVLSAVLG